MYQNLAIIAVFAFAFSAIAGMTVEIVVYSLLSLTIIRMLPMVLALTGTGEDFETKLFLSWFGPRGLASIVFAIIVIGANLPSQSILVNTVVCTVTLCVVAHGITANVWANRISKKETVESWDRTKVSNPALTRLRLFRLIC